MIAHNTCKLNLTPLFTDKHTQISIIKKFGIQPCAHSLIASPFGLAMIIPCRIYEKRSCVYLLVSYAKNE